MRLVTLDLEMNNGPGRRIIQLGYVISDPKTKAIKLRRSLYVNPGEPIGPEITELTGITDNHVRGAGDLIAAYEVLVKDMKLHSATRIPLQWGLDNLELQHQVGLPWTDFCLSKRAIDVKSLFQSWTMTSSKTSMVAGLSKAIDKLGSKFVGTPHDALADAENTLRAFHLLTDKMRLGDCVFDVVTEIYRD